MSTVTRTSHPTHARYSLQPSSCVILIRTSTSLSRSRERANVYGWIGGDRPSDVLEQAKARKAQGFTAVKMNAVESVSRTALLCSDF